MDEGTSLTWAGRPLPTILTERDTEQAWQGTEQVYTYGSLVIEHTGKYLVTQIDILCWYSKPTNFQLLVS